jgi:low temperature requirement protein LtrA
VTSEQPPLSPVPQPDEPVRAAGIDQPVGTTVLSISWLELFYDLVMVAAIIVFSHGVSVDPTANTILRTSAIFAVLWWVWLITTLLVNVDPTINTTRRGLLFAQMLTMVLLIIVGSHTETEWRDPLSVMIGVLLALVAVLHEVTRRTRPELVGFAVSRRNAFFVAAVLSSVSGVVPLLVSAIMWGFIALLLVVPVLIDRFDRGVDRPVSNLEHLAERLAALTTIVLGESFIRVALTGSGRHLYEINFVIVCLEFVIVCALWIAYFDDVGVAGMPEGRRRQRWWLVGHLPLHLGIIGAAIGLGAFATLQQSNDLTDADIKLLTVPLVLAFVSLGAIGLCSSRVPKMPLVVERAATAVFIILVAYVTWYTPQVTIKEGVALFGIVTIVYGVVSHELLRRSSLPASRPLTT